MTAADDTRGRYADNRAVTVYQQGLLRHVVEQRALADQRIREGRETLDPMDRALLEHFVPNAMAQADSPKAVATLLARVRHAEALSPEVRRMAERSSGAMVVDGIRVAPVYSTYQRAVVAVAATPDGGVQMTDGEHDIVRVGNAYWDGRTVGSSYGDTTSRDGAPPVSVPVGVQLDGAMNDPRVVDPRPGSSLDQRRDVQYHLSQAQQHERRAEQHVRAAKRSGPFLGTVHSIQASGNQAGAVKHRAEAESLQQQASRGGPAPQARAGAGLSL